MGNQEYDFVFCVLPKIGKYRIFRISIQCRKRIVQNHHRTRMRQRSDQCQPLGLTAGKAYTARTDYGFNPIFHGQHFFFQRRGSQKRERILLAAA